MIKKICPRCDTENPNDFPEPGEDRDWRGLCRLCGQEVAKIENTLEHLRNKISFKKQKWDSENL